MIQGKSGDAQPPGKTRHSAPARFGFKENRQFRRGETVAVMLRDLLAREFPNDSGEPS